MTDTISYIRSDTFRRHIFYIVLIAMTIGTALMLGHRLDDRSLCGDEMEHRRMVQQPVSRIMRGWDVQAEPIPQLIKHYVIKIRDTPAFLRVLGITGGIAMVFLAGLLGAHIMGYWGGLIMAWMVMFCPVIMKWGQFDRFYTFGTAIMILASLLFFYALKKDTWKSWAWYGIIAFVQIQTWRYGMVHLAVCGGIFAIAWLTAQIPFHEKLVYGHLNKISILRFGSVCVAIAALLYLQYITINDLILGPVFNPVNNDRISLYGPSSFSWETYRFVYQDYLPAYMHYKWLLVLGFFTALFMDREKSFFYTLMAVVTTWLIIYGMRENKASLSDNRMMFTVPFWAFFMARGALFFTDIFWRGGKWLKNKYTSWAGMWRTVQWTGAIAGVIFAVWTLIPLQQKAFARCMQFYKIDMTYCRNIGDFLAAAVGKNDAVYYEFVTEGLPAKYYYDRRRGTSPEMHTSKDINTSGYNISDKDIERVMAGECAMWLLPDWRTHGASTPRKLKQWLPQHSITLSIPHPWVPWNGPQKIVMAHKRIATMTAEEKRAEKIRLLNIFMDEGLYYNDSIAELLRLAHAHDSNDLFPRILNTVLKRYPDEPLLGRAIASIDVVPETITRALNSIPRSGHLWARHAADAYKESDFTSAANAYTRALVYTDTNTFSVVYITNILADTGHDGLRYQLEKHLQDEKVLKNYSPAQLATWANSAQFLGKKECIFPAKHEKRCIEYLVRNGVSNEWLNNRIAQYPYTEEWEFMEIANLLTHEKRYESVIVLLEKAVQRGIKSPVVALRLSDIYGKKDTPDAREKSIAMRLNYRNWLPSNDLTNRAQAAYGAGMLHMQNKAYDAAEKLFKDTVRDAHAVNYGDYEYRGYIQLGNIARTRKNWDTAVYCYTNVLAIHSNHVGTLHSLALCYDELNMTNAAKEIRDKINSLQQ